MTKQEEQKYFDYLNGVADGFKISNEDVIDELEEIRAEILKIPVHIKGIEFYKEREIHSYLSDILELIDNHIRSFKG